MITPIDSSELLTTHEAASLYLKKYIGYELAELNIQDPNASKVSVVFLADTEEEARCEGKKIHALKGKRISTLKGYGFPELEIGGICIVD